jgi:hypothetical protein
VNYVEAVTVLAIIQDPAADEADRMQMFINQFREHAELAKELWQDRYGEPWKD